MLSHTFGRGVKDLQWKLRKVVLSLLGIGAMVFGLFLVSVSARVAEPLNFPVIVVGIIAAVTGGLVFGVVAIAWLMGRALEWSESSRWRTSRRP